MSRQEFLDVRNRVVRVILGDLGHDPPLGIRRKIATDLGKAFRGRHDDDLLEGVLAGRSIDLTGESGGEVVLFELMQSVSPMLPNRVPDDAEPRPGASVPCR